MVAKMLESKMQTELFGYHADGEEMGKIIN